MATHDEGSKRGNTEGRAACSSSTHGKFQRPFRRGTVTRGCIELSFAMSIEKFHASVTCRATQHSPLLGTRNSHSDFPRGITLSLYFIRRRKVELSHCALWKNRLVRRNFASRDTDRTRENSQVLSVFCLCVCTLRYVTTETSFKYKYFSTTESI